MEKDSFTCGDLQYMDRLFTRFLKNKQQFFKTLEEMLDMATILPVCEDEYAAHLDQFIKFEEIYSALNEIKELFAAYNIRLEFSQLLAPKIH